MRAQIAPGTEQQSQKKDAPAAPSVEPAPEQAAASSPQPSTGDAHPTTGGLPAKLRALVKDDTRARRIILKAARLLSTPLMLVPPTVRDYLGWFGVVTAFNAVCFWLYFVLIGG